MHRLRRTGRAIRCPHILRCNNQYMYKIRWQRLIPSSTSSLGTAILQQTPAWWPPRPCGEDGVWEPRAGWNPPPTFRTSRHGVLA